MSSSSSCKSCNKVVSAGRKVKLKVFNLKEENGPRIQGRRGGGGPIKEMFLMGIFKAVFKLNDSALNVMYSEKELTESILSVM